jgi:hypothetical protein
MARSIEIKIIADTRGLRRALVNAERRVARSWWRRLALRVALWRIDREPAP